MPISCQTCGHENTNAVAGEKGRCPKCSMVYEQKCPKCSYTRQATDTGPEYSCVQCGLVFSKYSPQDELRRLIERAMRTGDWRDVPPEHVPPAIAASLVELSTTPILPGRSIKRSLGLVCSECMYGMNIFKDLIAGVTDVIGGRSGLAQNVLRDARAQVLAEMRLQAHAAGAQGIVGIQLTFNEFSGGGKAMLFVAGTGTAVEVA